MFCHNFLNILDYSALFATHINKRLEDIIIMDSILNVNSIKNGVIFKFFEIFI